MNVRLLLFSLCMATVLAGCGAAPQTPDAAIPVARAFLNARVAGNASDMYDLLTEPARKAMEGPGVAAWVRGRAFAYERLGAPIAREGGWVQVPVLGVVVRRGQDTVRWPEQRLTLRHDGARWQVAWAEPLMDRALLAYGNGDPTELFALGRTITAVDPFHYRGYLEQHFADRSLKRYREAEVWLLRARENATGPQLADVDDALARFKLELGQPADAAAAARRALENAAAYIPETYSRRWQADTMVVLGRALLAGGDRAAAEAIAQQASQIDPLNGTLAVFRQQLATPPAPPGPKPKSP